MAKGRVFSAAAALRACASTTSTQAPHPWRAGRPRRACARRAWRRADVGRRRARRRAARPCSGSGGRTPGSRGPPPARCRSRADRAHQCAASPRTSASSRRRISPAYASERSRSVRAARSSSSAGRWPSAGTAFCMPGTLFPLSPVRKDRSPGSVPRSERERRRVSRRRSERSGEGNARRVHAPARRRRPGTRVLRRRVVDRRDPRHDPRRRLRRRPAEHRLVPVRRAPVARARFAEASRPRPPGGRRSARSRCAAGGARRVPDPQLARSGVPLLGDRVHRRGAGADRALLRSEGGRLHPAAVAVRACS